MEVISWNNHMLNRNGRASLMRNEERITKAYARFLAARPSDRGSLRIPVALNIGSYRLMFSEDMISIMKYRPMAGTVSEVGEVRL